MNNETEIILIEDNISDADLMRRVLIKNKLVNTITRINEGQEALEHFEKQLADEDAFKQTARIILLDLKMPKVNGLVVLQKLKSDERTKNTRSGTNLIKRRFGFGGKLPVGCQ